MAYRVIQWGAGRNGSALIRGIARHRDLELVGCRVWSEDKNGVDAGTLAGVEPLGVAATTDVDALIALDADVVLFCPLGKPEVEETERELIALLRSGKNVISVSGAHSMASILPDGRGEALVAACLEGGSTLAAGGINPGFIAERLAPTLTGICTDVESVTIQETYLCLRATTIGFGTPLDQWTQESPRGRMFNEFFTQLIHNVAHSLGVELKEVEWTAKVTPAHRDIDHLSGFIPKGTLAAVEQEWRGIPVDPNQVVITKRTSWFAAADVPGFEPKRGWEIIIRGLPNIVANVRLDDESEVKHQPEAMVGSAIGVIPEVIAAKPGVLLPRIFAPFRKAFVEANEPAETLA